MLVWNWSESIWHSNFSRLILLDNCGYKVLNATKWYPQSVCSKRLDDLCLETSPHQRELTENFVRTLRAVCDRMGVNLAPKTDKETDFSCETSGTVLMLEMIHKRGLHLSQ